MDSKSDLELRLAAAVPVIGRRRKHRIRIVVDRVGLRIVAGIKAGGLHAKGLLAHERRVGDHGQRRETGIVRHKYRSAGHTSGHSRCADSKAAALRNGTATRIPAASPVVVAEMAVTAAGHIATVAHHVATAIGRKGVVLRAAIFAVIAEEAGLGVGGAPRHRDQTQDSDAKNFGSHGSDPIGCDR